MYLWRSRLPAETLLVVSNLEGVDRAPGIAKAVRPLNRPKVDDLI
jgi:hypothetical protein